MLSPDATYVQGLLKLWLVFTIVQYLVCIDSYTLWKSYQADGWCQLTDITGQNQQTLNSMKTVSPLRLWRPLMPYGYSHEASCARPG